MVSAGLLLAAPAVAVAAPGTPGATHPGGRVDIKSSRPVWAKASADRGTAGVPASLSARIYLAGQDPAGLAAYALSVSTPQSPDFGHFLTPAQVQAKFGATAAQVSAVRAWVTGAGLTVTGVTAHYVAVSGSSTAVQQAFGTAVHNFAAKGGTHYAPAGSLSVPNAVAPDVLSVTGLTNGEAMASPTDTLPGPADALFRPGPCSNFFGQQTAPSEPFAFNHVGEWVECGMTPQQERSVYGADTSGLTGRGATIAIVDSFASPTIAADVTAYTKAEGTTDFQPGQFTQSLPSAFTNVAACGGNVWFTEESLDIDVAHNMAPGANILYSGAASCTDADLTDAVARIVDNHSADIISGSWTFGASDTNTAAERAAFDQVAQEAAAEGIGIDISSGDCGAWDPATPCGAGNDKPQASYPSESPWVTSVGGTTLGIDSAGHQLFQSGWGNIISTPNAAGTAWTPAPGQGYPGNYDGGSGGGTSANYAQPQYQQGVVPTALATTLPDGTKTASPMRVEPDISADADNDTGVLIGETVTFLDGHTGFQLIRFGGTSVATPLFAGLQALVQQERGKPMGFANPQLYAKAGTAAIQDVTDTPFGAKTGFGVVRNDLANAQDPNSAVSTRLDVMGHDGLLHATAGFDDETGLGAPAPGAFLSSFQG